MMRFLKILASLFALIWLTGCGGATNGRPARVRATAEIQYQGQPVEGATVTLVPQADGGQAAFGTTDRTGTATLGTFEYGDGVIPGSYGVIVSKTVIEELTTLDRHGEPEVRDRHLLPERYGSPDSSGLTVTVVEGEHNAFSLELAD